MILSLQFSDTRKTQKHAHRSTTTYKEKTGGGAPALAPLMFSLYHPRINKGIYSLVSLFCDALTKDFQIK